MSGDDDARDRTTTSGNARTTTDARSSSSTKKTHMMLWPEGLLTAERMAWERGASVVDLAAAGETKK